MTSTFAERLRNNDRIQTTTSELPPFPGQFTAFNGNSGKFSIMQPGSNLSDASDINSLQFITHFVMTRLKYTPDATTKTLSNYVIAGEDTPYVMTVDGITHVADSGKQMAVKLGADANKLKQEQVFVGYIVNLDGEANGIAEPVWYVSRGVNAYLLNEAMNNYGQLSARTLIKVTAKGTTRTNDSGGTNMVLDFEISDIPEEKIDGFIKWSESAAQTIEQYRLDMISASERIVEAAKSATTPAPQVVITSGGQPTAQQQPAKVQGINPFTGKPVGAPADEIDINEDDLPF